MRNQIFFGGKKRHKLLWRMHGTRIDSELFKFLRIKNRLLAGKPHCLIQIKTSVRLQKKARRLRIDTQCPLGARPNELFLNEIDDQGGFFSKGTVLYHTKVLTDELGQSLNNLYRSCIRHMGAPRVLHDGEHSKVQSASQIRVAATVRARHSRVRT